MYEWRLKKGSDKKFKSGHPWVFSSELAQSPKNVQAGALVDLYEYEGAFLARGYGHPNSMISFRVLTRSKQEPVDSEFFAGRFLEASRARQTAGVYDYSHRFIFAEGDDLPGLIIDRFRLSNLGRAAQVFVLQFSTAGMDRLTESTLKGLELFVARESERDSQAPNWDSTAIVIANDSKSRALEGIEVTPKAVHRTIEGFSPTSAQILIQPSLEILKPVLFEVDFVGGQKTGFFLDQRLNVALSATLARNVMRNFLAQQAVTPSTELCPTLKILDLCCYVGQWGTQLAHLATSLGLRAEVTLLDASQKALEIAARNVEHQGGEAKTMKMDVLNDLSKLPKREYDIVICDPPAFIKKKKDLPAGTAAYHKLNREAIRRTKRGGLFVSCSCSGLFTEEEFRLVLAKASLTQENRVRWLLRGSHSPDHPQRPEFPQGTYLKSWMGIIL